MPKFALSISHHFYYQKYDVITQHTEMNPPVVLTENELELAIQACESIKQKYMVIQHHQMQKKFDYWAAYPESISEDELDFWYSIQIIDRDTYLKYQRLLSK